MQGLAALQITAPVSPSTPRSEPPLVYQTTASEVPSVVVAIAPVVTVAMSAHQAMVGVARLDGLMRIAINRRAPVPVGQPCAPLVVEMTT